MDSIFMFYGKPIEVAVIGDRHYVGVRSICDGVGISGYADQYKKLQSNPDVFTCKVSLTHDTSGREQEMLLIPLDKLNYWLCGITPSRVKPEIRAELVKYQLECAHVLYEHFLKKDSTDGLEGIVAQIMSLRKEMLETNAALAAQVASVTAAIQFAFGNDTPVITALIKEIAELEGIDGREVWADVQIAIDVQSYKKITGRIINYLKERKDGSCLKFLKGGIQ